MLSLTLPFPPSANTYYRNFKGRMVLSEAGRKFRNEVAGLFLIARAKRQEGRLALFVELHPPTLRKYDADNRLKALQDALQHAGAFDDDEQIDAVAVFKDEVVKGGMCKVLIVQADAKRETVIVDLTKFAVKQSEAA
jgi:crossover junction endodeoxyribonuclease RusA